MNFQNISFFLKPKLQVTFLKHKFSDCSQRITKCVLPRPPPMSVTVVAANSKVGRISAMLFKKESIFKRMYLHDKHSTEALRCDLNTVNTSPHVKGYHGTRNLEAAVKNTRIVYISSGIPTCPGLSEIDLFDRNAAWVRQVITYCSEFNPQVHVVIATPPVSFLVPMVVEEFRKSHINAEKRVYGVTKILVSRANSLTAKTLKADPAHMRSFVVGGCRRRNFIPVLSHIQSGSSNKELTYLIQDAEDAVLRKKMTETDNGGCALSIAYCGVQFTTLLAKALLGASNVPECAFVKQDKPMDEYAKYFSSLVNFCKDGIKSTEIPKMSQLEKTYLKRVMTEIRHHIFLGSSYITGDDMIVVRVPPKEKKGKSKDAKKPKSKEAKPGSKGKKEECPPKPAPPKSIRVKVEKEIPC